jgi:hypothetical protein
MSVASGAGPEPSDRQEVPPGDVIYLHRSDSLATKMYDSCIGAAGWRCAKEMSNPGRRTTLG